MAECVQCRSYTNVSKRPCYECYQEKNGKSKSHSETSALTGRELDYRYTMIKGRIAETLIQE